MPYVAREASPIDEEAASDPGFEGAYKGKQDGIRGRQGSSSTSRALAIRRHPNMQCESVQLQTCLHMPTSRAAHFDMNDAEKQAAAGFVLLERSAKSDMSGENRQIMLDGQELKAAEANLVSKETPSSAKCMPDFTGKKKHLHQSINPCDLPQED
eukprot:5798314-Amphidinium_carterae.1